MQSQILHNKSEQNTACIFLSFTQQSPWISADLFTRFSLSFSLYSNSCCKYKSWEREHYEKKKCTIFEKLNLHNSFYRITDLFFYLNRFKNENKTGFLKVEEIVCTISNQLNRNSNY